MTKSAGQDSKSDRIAGPFMVGAAMLSIPVMAHHPTSIDGPFGLIQLVHGGLIVTSLLLLVGFVRVSARLGIGSFSTLTALVAYSLGIIGAILAATINGFVVPALASEGQLSREVARFCWEFNQALAYQSAYAISAAFIFWGARLVRSTVRADVALGWAALFAGIVPALLLATSIVDMHAVGALVVYAAQWLFSACAGGWLTIRSKVDASEAEAQNALKDE